MSKTFSGLVCALLALISQGETYAQGSTIWVSNVGSKSCGDFLDRREALVKSTVDLLLMIKQTEPADNTEEAEKHTASEAIDAMRRAHQETLELAEASSRISMLNQEVLAYHTYAHGYHNALMSVGRASHPMSAEDWDRFWATAAEKCGTFSDPGKVTYGYVVHSLMTRPVPRRQRAR